MLTRIFKSGNSIAVRIPKGLSIFDGEVVEIERVGSTLVLRSAQQETLEDVMGIFASFPKGFMAEGRDESSEVDRNWGAFGADFSENLEADDS